MKILLVTTVFPTPLQPNKGAFNREMVRALGASHDVRVIAPMAWPIVWRARREGRVWAFARRLDGIEVRHPVYVYTPKLLRHCYGAFFWWSIRQSVNQMLQGFEPDVVIGYWAHPDGQAAVRVARRLGVPAVVMVGGTDVLVLGHEARRRRAIRRVLENAAAIVTVSQDLKRTLETWGLPTSKIQVVHRGVDVARFKPGARDAARRRLGIDTRYANAALGRPHGVRERARGTRRRLRESRNPDRFSPLPRRERSFAWRAAAPLHRAGNRDMRDICGLRSPHRSARLVSGSRSDGAAKPFGRHPQRAARVNCVDTPFVASCVGGVPEIADPLVDRLVAPGDAEALADAIVHSLTAPSRIDRRAMPISTAEAGDQLLGVLASAVSARRAARPIEVPVGASGRDAVRVRS